MLPTAKQHQQLLDQGYTEVGEGEYHNEVGKSLLFFTDDEEQQILIACESVGIDVDKTDPQGVTRALQRFYDLFGSGNTLH